MLIVCNTQYPTANKGACPLYICSSSFEIFPEVLGEGNYVSTIIRPAKGLNN